MCLHRLLTHAFSLFQDGFILTLMALLWRHEADATMVVFFVA